MQDFLQFDRRDRKKRDVFQRVSDFSEIYKDLKDKQSANQSKRCVQCGIPYCAYGCPLGNFIPHWLKNIADKDLETAFAISNETSPFPEIMGKICPHDKLCEGACTLNADELGAVSIGSIEQYISENGFKQGFKIKYTDKKVGKKVAIIGSGPAGLSTATFLMRAGVDVTIYEKEDRAGGLLTYGIPNFKLDKKGVQKRVDMLLENGLNLTLNTEIGKDISIDDIVEKYDAVFVGVGATKAFFAGIENENHANCFQAMEFLNAVQKAQFEITNSKIDTKNKNVVVIGGGDTAMDCVRTAIRQQANNVSCLYRRGEDDMPGSKKEFINAREEKVDFQFFLSPKTININKDKITSITMTKTEVKDNKLIYLDETIDITADIIIFALGFKVDDISFFDKASITKDNKGRVDVSNYKTSHPKIYAGGDCVRGADLVVNAALDGREASRIILQDLGVIM